MVQAGYLAVKNIQHNEARNPKSAEKKKSLNDMPVVYCLRFPLPEKPI